MEAIRVFRCPKCNEMINDRMDSCRFCSSPIDKQTAIQEAELQEKVTDAYNQVNHLKWLAGGSLGFCLSVRLALWRASLGPVTEKGIEINQGPEAISAIVGSFVFGLLAIWLTIRLIMWRSKFADLKSGNKDTKEALVVYKFAIIISSLFIIAYLFFYIRNLIGLATS